MFILDILELLLAVVVWLVVRKAAKISAKEISEATNANTEDEEYDEEIEDAKKEQKPVRTFEGIFVKYTVYIAIIFAVLTFLIFLSAINTNENVKYIFLFNGIIWISSHTLCNLTLSIFIRYVEISAIYLLILVIRGKQRKKTAKSIGVILATVVFVFVGLFLFSVNSFLADHGGRCKIYEENGHKLVLQDVRGFLSSETYIFEVRSMTDVHRRKTLDCKLDNVIDVKWTNDKAVINYEKSNFLQGSCEESVDVYFSD